MPGEESPAGSLMCECSHHWSVHAESGQTANSAACHGYTGSATPGPLREPCRCTGFRAWAGPWDSRTGLPVKPLMASTATVGPREPVGDYATLLNARDAELVVLESVIGEILGHVEGDKLMLAEILGEDPGQLSAQSAALLAIRDAARTALAISDD